MTGSSDAESGRIARRFRVRGRVQRVGFRAFTRDRARALGLAGWVRNLPDGGVEAEVSGEAEAMEQFRDIVRRGPRFARVDALEEEPLADGPPVGEFSIRR